jgi:hypothetical protein
MPVVVTCPACQRKARVPNAAIGKTVKCPGCGASLPTTAAAAELTPPPTRLPPDLPDVPEPVEITPEEDALRTERTGVGLLAVSQALLAACLVMRLILLLVLITSGVGSKGSTQESGIGIVAIVELLTVLAAGVTALIGAVYCTLAPGPLTHRAAIASSLLFAFLTINQLAQGMLRDLFAKAQGVGISDRGYDAIWIGGLAAALAPVGLEAARQVMLAVYARAQARRLGENVAAALAGILAITYPFAMLGLASLVLLVAVFSSQQHPTFNQVMAVVEMLVRTILVAWGGFVLWRVWTRLRPV